MMKCVAVVGVVAALACCGSAADAQVVTSYYAPTTVYYAPAPRVYAVASPVVVAEPAPAPTVTYYAPPAIIHQPVARVRTRYRPILGGSVTRVHYGYAPMYYPPVRY